MNMNREQIGLAVRTGVELLGETSQLTIPVRMNDGVFLLRQLLVQIGSGQIALSAVPQAPTPEQIAEHQQQQETEGQEPTRNERRVAKKIAAKKGK